MQYFPPKTSVNMYQDELSHIPEDSNLQFRASYIHAHWNTFSSVQWLRWHMLHILIPLTGVIFRYQAPYIKNINVLKWKRTRRGKGRE
jgi:hypothetical protein